MKHRYRLVSTFAILVTLAVACVFCGCVGNQHEQTRPLLYVTTLPDLSKSIAILDPSESACSDPTFVDTTLRDVESVRWSSDRSQIEYVVHSSQYITYSLRVMNPDGSDREQIVSSIPVGFGGELIRLSPDHRYVAFLCSDAGKDPAQWEIDIVDAETGTTRQLMAGVWLFEWAPVGNLIAITGWRLNDGALYIVQPDGTILDRYQDVVLVAPHWSPDGHQIAFSSSYLLGQGSLPVAEIHIIDIDSAHQVQVTHGVGQYEKRLVGSLSWSPDGKQIAFVSNHTAQDGTSEANVLFVVDVDSGDETRLATAVEWALPVWSPDGKQIAFVSTMDGSNYGQIYTVHVATGTITRLTCDDRIKTSLSW
jgi:Tol biopolymer transport system component